MRYCINMRDCKFFIKNIDKLNALLEIKKLMLDADKKGDGGSWNGRKKEKGWFSWVDTDVVLIAKTLEEAMGEWGYEPETNESGDITNIEFIGEKIGQEQLMFDVIAPFVKKGSYIEMQGEDGAIWRWKFDGKKVTEQSAKISF